MTFGVRLIFPENGVQIARRMAYEYDSTPFHFIVIEPVKFLATHSLFGVLMIKPNVFRHSTLSSYVKELYDLNKQSRSEGSLRWLANQLGFKSAAGIKYIIEGKQSLGPQRLKKFISALHLSPLESDYLRELMALQKKLKQRQPVQAHGLNLVDISKLEKTQTYEFDQIQALEKWAHLAVLELSEVSGFQGTPEWVANRLNISLAAAQESLDLLEKVQLLVKSRGVLRKRHFTNDSRDEVNQWIIKKYHAETLALAGQAVYSQDVKDREFGSLVMSISSEKQKKIKSMMKKFRSELFEEIKKPDEKPDRVYTFQFQFFRLDEGSEE